MLTEINIEQLPSDHIGLEKGFDTATHQIAMNAHKKGMSLDDIAELTGISLDELAQIPLNLNDPKQ